MTPLVRVLLLPVVYLAFVSLASAHLGQAPGEIEARLGPGKPVPTQEPAEEAKGYTVGRLHLLVEYCNGVSSSEQYQTTDGSVIPETEIAALLGSNAGSSSWHQASNDVWVRVDKAAVAYIADKGKALVLQLYAYHLEEKKKSEKTSEADPPRSAAPAAAPRIMTKIVSRYISADTPPDSFAAKPKIAYMAGTTYSRAEEEDDPAQHLHQLIICVEPDIWVINLEGMQGRHIVDPGPTFEVHNPLLGTEASGNLSSLEMGKEVAFFQEHGATRLGKLTIEGQSCEAFEYKESNYRLVLNSRRDTHQPFQLDVFKDGKLDFSVRYMSYETDLPFDPALFTPPANASITEVKANA